MITVLGQLPPSKIFLQGNCPVPPNPKVIPNLHRNPNLTGEQFTSGGNCPDTYDQSNEMKKIKANVTADVLLLW